MSLRLGAARVFLPPFLKRKHFRRLFLITAESFGATLPALEGLSYEAGLRLFVSFTRENALKALAGNGAEAVGDRLYRSARALGEELRRSLGVRTSADVMAAARVLYRAIGIDLRGDPGGAVVIRSCRFARDYTPEICGLISSLDRGILAGLAGGGELRFSRRLTEGHDSCRAVLGREGGRG
jgi:hypothetical protein